MVTDDKRVLNVSTLTFETVLQGFVIQIPHSYENLTGTLELQLSVFGLQEAIGWGKRCI